MINRQITRGSGISVVVKRMGFDAALGFILIMVGIVCQISISMATEKSVEF